VLVQRLCSVARRDKTIQPSGVVFVGSEFWLLQQLPQVLFVAVNLPADA
jgi:hypothetical protein